MSYDKSDNSLYAEIDLQYWNVDLSGSVSWDALNSTALHPTQESTTWLYLV